MLTWLSTTSDQHSYGRRRDIDIESDISRGRKKNRLMKQTIRIIFMSCMAGFALPAFAAEQPITDVGTLDETSAKEAFPSKPPYSPYAGRNFPTRPFFGDTHLHTSFSMDAGAFGCRLDAAGCLPLRQRRGGHRFEWPARKAVAPARFSCRQRSFGWLWFFSTINGWRSRVARDAARAQMVRRDHFRQRRAGGGRHHHQFRQGPIAERISVAGHAGLSLGLAGNNQGRG